MTRLSDSLKTSPALRVKTFELAGHTFKVTVPLNSELEAITSRVNDIPEDVKNTRLSAMIKTLTPNDSPVEGIEVKGDDLIVEGRSVKETIIAVIQMERKIVEYFKLLVPESGTLEDLTYEEIEAEFPLQVQFELLEKITEAIQPGYKEARKNS
jgi:hypothetical protein